MTVSFVYLDEFGHIGPYMSRKNPRYNESPVFGLAGIILPENAVRPFATWFLQLKQRIFDAEIAASGKSASHWEGDTFHKMSAKYLPLYIAAFRFGYNNRMDSNIFEGAIKGC